MDNGNYKHYKSDMNEFQFCKWCALVIYNFSPYMYNKCQSYTFTSPSLVSKLIHLGAQCILMKWPSMEFKEQVLNLIKCLLKSHSVPP